MDQKGIGELGRRKRDVECIKTRVCESFNSGVFSAAVAAAYVGDAVSIIASSECCVREVKKEYKKFETERMICFGRAQKRWTRKTRRWIPSVPRIRKELRYTRDDRVTIK
jgi:hypothetical protein